MHCKYITVKNSHNYPLPDTKDDKLIIKFMEELADKYEATDLILSPEYSRDKIYVFTFQIPEKFTSEEYIEIWDNLIKEKEKYAKTEKKEEIFNKYTVNLTR